MKKKSPKEQTIPSKSTKPRKKKFPTTKVAHKGKKSPKLIEKSASTEIIIQRVVGLFTRSKSFGFVQTDGRKMKQDIYIAKKDFNGAVTGQKVAVEITKTAIERQKAEGKIIEILGRENEQGIDVLSIIVENGLPLNFPDKVLELTDKISTTITERDWKYRKDRSDLPIVTIDSEDARDLDDAVYVDILPNKNFFLGVYIADVSYYVKENTSLDFEARERGTSVYLVDRVLPMLPEKLSNGICSLNAKVERLALACEMEINPEGRVVHYELFPAVIKVHTRLSYKIVREILAGDSTTRHKFAELIPQINIMNQLRETLQKKRSRRGAIDFNFPEQKVILDDKGKPLSIEKRIQGTAESIIEEFMLAANETVAEHLYKLNLPSIYRVHETPDHEKITLLKTLLHNFDILLPTKKEITPQDLQTALAAVKGKPEERFLSTVMLRSLRQANYQMESLGHFGLATKFYTHFTSPIRRYPDLIVHRLLRESWYKKNDNEQRIDKLKTLLPTIAKHASARERLAIEAERMSVDLKKAEYMKKFIGEHFAGIICSVTSFGVFVELDNGVEGMVHISDFPDDYYIYQEENFSLVGRRYKKVYRLGDPIEIIVQAVNLRERTISFVLK